jgi:hypothetical protein
VEKSLLAFEIKGLEPEKPCEKKGCLSRGLREQLGKTGSACE